MELGVYRFFARAGDSVKGETWVEVFVGVWVISVGKMTKVELANELLMRQLYLHKIFWKVLSSL